MSKIFETTQAQQRNGHGGSAELWKEAGIVPNTMTKLRKNLTVNLKVLEKICKTLQCDFGDVVEYIDRMEKT